MARKRIVLLLILGLVAVCVLGFGGCNDTGLAAPTVLEVDNDDLEISWLGIEGADGYMLAFNGNTGMQFYTAATVLDLKTADVQIINSLKSGEENTVMVRAVNMSEVDGARPENASKWSNSVSFIYTKQVSTVTRLTFNETNNTLKWRAVRESGASYKLFIRIQNETEGESIDLSSYSLTPNSTTGFISLDITDILSTFSTNTYEITVVAYLAGYDDSEYSDFYTVNWQSDRPSEDISLVAINAEYVGTALKVNDPLPDGAIQVTAIYSSNVNVPVYDFSTDFSVQNKSAGLKTITVTYKEGEVTRTDTVSILFEEDGSTSPSQDGYRILGVGGDWTSGLVMTQNPVNATEYMYLGLTVNGTDGIKIYHDDVYYATVKSGVRADYSYSEPDGNIVLKEGTYDLYFDSVAQELWIEMSGALDGGFIYLDITEVSWYTNDNAAIYCYIWYTDDEMNAAYPGEIMTASNGLFSVEVDTSKTVEGVIFVRIIESGATRQEFNKIELSIENGGLTGYSQETPLYRPRFVDNKLEGEWKAK